MISHQTEEHLLNVLLILLILCVWGCFAYCGRQFVLAWNRGDLIDMFGWACVIWLMSQQSVNRGDKR